MDSASLRLSLRLYDQYVRKVQECAWQLIVEGELSHTASQVVGLKYCVDIDWINSLIDLELIKGVESYELLQDYQLW